MLWNYAAYLVATVKAVGSTDLPCLGNELSCITGRVKPTGKSSLAGSQAITIAEFTMIAEEQRTGLSVLLATLVDLGGAPITDQKEYGS